jgi:hypothetical protein
MSETAEDCFGSNWAKSDCLLCSTAGPLVALAYELPSAALRSAESLDSHTPEFARSNCAGAGEGNRTLVCSLGSCRSTIELRPPKASHYHAGGQREKIGREYRAIEDARARRT